MGFEATEADVEAEFERAGIEDVKAAVKQWKDQGRLPAIRDSIKRTKALDYLVENAKVTVKDEVAERAEAQKAESRRVGSSPHLHLSGMPREPVSSRGMLQ